MLTKHLFVINLYILPHQARIASHIDTELPHRVVFLLDTRKPGLMPYTSV